MPTAACLPTSRLQVAAHEVRRVVPHPAPAAAVQVAAIQVAADGTADLQTAAAHPFSGAKQLATLAGLPGGLDGHYPIVASDRRKSQLLFRIKLPRQEADTVAAVQQAVAGGGITVRWARAVALAEELLHALRPSYHTTNQWCQRLMSALTPCRILHPSVPVQRAVHSGRHSHALSLHAG